MLWRELTDLEPDLTDLEKWVRTLDPDAPQVMHQIEERLRTLIGWHREIPGVEVVPFDGPWPVVRDQKEHDRLTGNSHRRRHFFKKLPLHTRVLYTSEAWDAALHHLTIVLRARRRDLEESSRTGEGETHNEETSTMHESDFASTGIMTVGELRKRLRGLPAEADVCVYFDGYLPAAITDFEFKKSENVVLLSPDPAGQIGRRLSGQSGE